MTTYNSILKELKDVPADRLEEVHNFIHALSLHKRSGRLRKKIMSFAGAFSEMSDKDYKDFLKKTRSVRNELFDRSIEE